MREPYRLPNPFKWFPPRIDRDWLAILGRIPVGWGLEVPVSRGTVTMALGHLAARGRIKRHEYAANSTAAGGCIIYHLQVFTGEPFTIEPRPRPRSTGYWDGVLRKVMSGEAVAVDAPYISIHMALRKRLHGRVLRTVRCRKEIMEGKERFVLRRSSTPDWDEVLRRVMLGQTVTLDAPYGSVYMALRRRLGKVSRTVRCEKTTIDGNECVVLRRR